MSNKEQQEQVATEIVCGTTTVKINISPLNTNFYKTTPEYKSLSYISNNSAPPRPRPRPPLPTPSPYDLTIYLVKGYSITQTPLKRSYIPYTNTIYYNLISLFEFLSASGYTTTGNVYNYLFYVDCFVYNFTNDKKYYLQNNHEKTLTELGIKQGDVLTFSPRN